MLPAGKKTNGPRRDQRRQLWVRVTFGGRRGGCVPEQGTLSERPDWRGLVGGSRAHQDLLAYHPPARPAWRTEEPGPRVRWMRHPPPPTSGKDQEDGLKGSSLTGHPPRLHLHPWARMCAPNSSPLLCVFVLLTPIVGRTSVDSLDLF